METKDLRDLFLAIAIILVFGIIIGLLMNYNLYYRGYNQCLTDYVVKKEVSNGTE